MTLDDHSRFKSFENEGTITGRFSGAHANFKEVYKDRRMRCVMPGRLFGKTALVHVHRNGMVAAQFGDLSLGDWDRGPGLTSYCYGWHSFRKEHFDEV